MSHALFNILFLCTGNSARSILAEAIANKDGRGRFVGYSAGSFPKGEVHPQALALLSRLGYPTGAYRSKSWDEFAGEGAPVVDFIITVCDNAAGEICPIWPGHPTRAHWGIPDPAAATGSEAEMALAFNEAYRQLKTRIGLLLSLPVDKLDALSLKRRLDEIGQTKDASQPA